LNGANIDLKDPLGNTPLAYAAMNNCFEATHSLIERGAKIDVKDKYGYTIIEKAKNR
jgi:ankyrin repeat protein